MFRARTKDAFAWGCDRGSFEHPVGRGYRSRKPYKTKTEEGCPPEHASKGRGTSPPTHTRFMLQVAKARI